jgi:hypothetical protein
MSSMHKDKLSEGEAVEEIATRLQYAFRYKKMKRRLSVMAPDQKLRRRQVTRQSMLVEQEEEEGEELESWGTLLIRPDSKFAVRWRLVVALVACVEILRVLAVGGGESTDVAFELFAKRTFMDSACLAPEPVLAKRRLFGLLKPKKQPPFVAPEWCEQEGSMTEDHAEQIGELVHLFVSTIATLDVVVNFVRAQQYVCVCVD